MILPVIRYIFNKGSEKNTHKNTHYMLIISVVAFFLIFLVNLSFAQPNEDSKRGFYIDSKPAGATVKIENEIIGKTPCWFPYSLTGKYRLKAEKEGYEACSSKIDFSKFDQTSVLLTLTPKSHIKAVVRSVFLTSWGQFYSGKQTQGTIFLTLQVSSLISLGYAHLEYEKKFDEYKNQMNIYRKRAKSYQNEPKARQNLMNSHKDLESRYNLRQSFIYVAAGVYALNILEMMLSYPKKFRESDIIGRPLSAVNVNNETILVGLSWAF